MSDDHHLMDAAAGAERESSLSDFVGAAASVIAPAAASRGLDLGGIGADGMLGDSLTDFNMIMTILFPDADAAERLRLFVAGMVSGKGVPMPSPRDRPRRRHRVPPRPDRRRDRPLAGDGGH